LIIPFLFEVARSFHEGLAVAAVNRQAGYIDSRGRFVIKPRFTIAGDFSGGVAAVRVGGKTGTVTYGAKGGRWAFIGKDGKTKIGLPKSVEQAEDFSEGRAAIRTLGKCGYIDTFVG